MRLAAGLHPDPLGELKRSPRPPSYNRGRSPTSKGTGGKGRKVKGRGGEEKGGGLPLLYLTSSYGPGCGAVSVTVFTDQNARERTLTTPFASLGSSHCTTTVVELTGLARTLSGALPGTNIHSHSKLAQRSIRNIQYSSNGLTRNQLFRNGANCITR